MHSLSIILKDKMSPKECLKKKPASLSNECVKLNRLLFECKRSMVRLLFSIIELS